MTPGQPLRLRVEVASPPAPGLLRAAIERRVAGGAFPSGPEDAVGQAVARAVRESQGKEQRWR
jgi:hypothetical protein